MRTTVQRWGNSLAVRIPRHLAAESRVSQGTAVEVRVRDGNLILIPLRAHRSLRQLVRGITKANRHGETRTGPAVGKEAW